MNLTDRRRELMSAKASALPAGYARLEYIQKQGTTARIAIPTSYVQLQIGDIIKLRMSITKGGNKQCFIGWSNQWDAEISADMKLGTWWGVTKILPVSNVIAVDVVYDFAYSIRDSRGTSGMNIGSYNNNGSSYPFYGRFYAVSAERNGQTLLNLIPTKRISDGAVGLYDTIQGNFMTSPYAAFEEPEQEGEQNA